MNMAFMGKMEWRVINENDKLWTEVIRAKYGWNEENVDNIKPKKGSSNLWQGITKAIPLICQGFSFTVRNGKQTRFWTNVWLGDKPLSERCLTKREGTYDDERVADLWRSGRGWKWEKLHNTLPEDLKKKLELINLGRTQTHTMNYSGTRRHQVCFL